MDEIVQYVFFCPPRVGFSKHVFSARATNYECLHIPIQGFLEVSNALDYAVDVVVEVSVYANDFQRQLDHPVFGMFVKALLRYASTGKLFMQGSMCGGRAVSDAIVPLLVSRLAQDNSGSMKELLRERQNSPYAGADEIYHILEDVAVYKQDEYADVVSRVQAAGASLLTTAKQSWWPTWWDGLLPMTWVAAIRQQTTHTVESFLAKFSCPRVGDQ